MMKNVKKWMLAALILPATLGATSVLAAGGDKGPHDRDCGPGAERALFKQLNLSDAQQEQLRSLREQGRAEMKKQPRAGMREEMQALHQQERALMLAPNFDKAAATALAKQMAEKQVEHRVRMMEKRHQMLNVLTAEQKSQFESLQQERMTQCWKEGPRGGHPGSKGEHGYQGDKGQQGKKPVPASAQ